MPSQVGITSKLKGLTYAKLRHFYRTTSSAMTPAGLTRFTSVTVTQSGSVLTLTSASLAPFLLPGDDVTLSGGSVPAYVGRWRVNTVVGNTFTLVSDTFVGGGAATVTVDANFEFHRAVMFAKKAPQTDNTGSVFIGPSSTTLLNGIELAVGVPYSLDPAPGCKLDLADLQFEVATANDGIYITFH